MPIDVALGGKACKTCSGTKFMDGNYFYYICDLTHLPYYFKHIRDVLHKIQKNNKNITYIMMFRSLRVLLNLSCQIC